MEKTYNFTETQQFLNTVSTPKNLAEDLYRTCINLALIVDEENAGVVRDCVQNIDWAIGLIETIKENPIVDKQQVL